MQEMRRILSMTNQCAFCRVCPRSHDMNIKLRISMSEFTKEELEFMHKWLNWITEENYPLKNKIKSMIDGHCQHESDGEAYTNRAAFFNKCRICGEFYR